METKLTEEQLKDYLQANGTHCPFCKSESLESDETGFISQGVTSCQCNSCGSIWSDSWKLLGIDTEMPIIKGLKGKK